LCECLSLKYGLGEERNQSIAATFRGHLQLDDVLPPIGIDDKICPHVCYTKTAVNSPASFPERARKDTLEFGAGSDAIRDSHTPSPHMAMVTHLAMLYNTAMVTDREVACQEEAVAAPGPKESARQLRSGFLQRKWADVSKASSGVP